MMKLNASGSIALKRILRNAPGPIWKNLTNEKSIPAWAAATISEAMVTNTKKLILMVSMVRENC